MITKMNWRLFSIVMLIAIAAALRIFGGVDWGLPFKYDPDEGAFIQPAIDMYISKDLNPKWFGHPGSTVIYLNMFVYILLSKTMIFLGDFQTAIQVLNYFKNDPSLLYIILRLLQVIIGCVIVALVYRIGRRVFNVTVGILSAAIITFSPLMIHYSQIVRTDMLAAMFMLLVVDRVISIDEKSNIQNYSIVAIFIGGAIATKYPAGIVVFYLMWVHFIKNGLIGKFHYLALAGVLSVISLFIFSPFMFIDYKSVIRDLVLEAGGNYVGAMSPGFFDTLVWYIVMMVKDSIGVFGGIFFLMGAIGMIRTKSTQGIGLLIFTIIFLISISTLSVRWERWLVLVLPFVAIILSFGVYVMAETDWIKIKFKSKGIFISLLVVIPIAFAGINQMHSRLQVDTRTQAFEWILENINKDAHIIVEAYGPQLPAGHYKMSMIVNGVPIERGQGSGFVMPARSVAGLENIALLSDADVEYVIISNFYDRYKLFPEGNEQAINNYHELFKKSILIKEFRPIIDGELHPFKANLAGGPIIKIFKISKR